MNYKILLKSNHTGAEQESFFLPVLPEDLKFTRLTKVKDKSLLTGAPVSTGLANNLMQITFEALIPANAGKQPSWYLSLLDKWQSGRTPVRLIYTAEDWDVNTVTLLSKFVRVEKGGDAGAMYFSFVFTEYQPPVIKVYNAERNEETVPIISEQSDRPDVFVKPETYSVAQGDSLWSIAQRFYGDGSRSREIQAINKIPDSVLADALPVGRELVLP